MKTGAGVNSKTVGDGNVNQKATACFIAGTLIWGRVVRAIEEIRAGDYVYSYNEGIGQSEERKVLQTFIHDVDEVLDIYLGNDTVITTTEEHPFYVNGKYINAGELKEGMLLMTNSCDKISIVKIVVRKLKEKINVYNIEIDGNHNYFVGENKVLVHNKNIKNPQKQVGYDSDLGQEALKFRMKDKKNKITSADRNVAVYEIDEECLQKKQNKSPGKGASGQEPFQRPEQENGQSRL